MNPTPSKSKDPQSASQRASDVLSTPISKTWSLANIDIEQATTFCEGRFDGSLVLFDVDNERYYVLQGLPRVIPRSDVESAILQSRNLFSGRTFFAVLQYHCVPLALNMTSEALKESDKLLKGNFHTGTICVYCFRLEQGEKGVFICTAI